MKVIVHLVMRGDKCDFVTLEQKRAVTRADAFNRQRAKDAEPAEVKTQSVDVG